MAQWIGPGGNYLSVTTPPITVFDSIADGYSVRLQLGYAHRHPSLPLSSIQLFITMQIGLHQRATIIPNHHPLSKFILVRYHIPTLSCSIVDFTSPAYNAPRECSSFLSTSKLFTLAFQISDHLV